MHIIYYSSTIDIPIPSTIFSNHKNVEVTPCMVHPLKNNKPLMNFMNEILLLSPLNYLA